MYRLRVESHFDAAHKLIGYKGKCASLHGHTWKVEVFVTGDRLKNGILVDFQVPKESLEGITGKLDHVLLNDIRDIGNPTVENISKYIFERIVLPEDVKLEKVRVWESPRSWGEYLG
ncbi:6-carboxytetrahydropterin synthase QueD [Candidatus Bathyarchaeota archaeon]|nr:6-carboxytetrahydropterin synthase QueD [Candidatus Bathyarchaeota archaeon]